MSLHNPIHPHAEFIIDDLRNLRREQNINYEKLSKIIGTSPKAIEHWERKITQPTLSNFCRWAEALGYELDLHPINKRRTHV